VIRLNDFLVVVIIIIINNKQKRTKMRSHLSCITTNKINKIGFYLTKFSLQLSIDLPIYHILVLFNLIIGVHTVHMIDSWWRVIDRSEKGLKIMSNRWLRRRFSIKCRRIKIGTSIGTICCCCSSWKIASIISIVRSICVCE